MSPFWCMANSGAFMLHSETRRWQCNTGQTHAWVVAGPQRGCSRTSAHHAARVLRCACWRGMTPIRRQCEATAPVRCRSAGSCSGKCTAHPPTPPPPVPRSPQTSPGTPAAPGRRRRRCSPRRAGPQRGWLRRREAAAAAMRDARCCWWWPCRRRWRCQGGSEPPEGRSSCASCQSQTARTQSSKRCSLGRRFAPAAVPPLHTSCHGHTKHSPAAPGGAGGEA